MGKTKANQIFPVWANRLPFILVVLVFLLGLGATGFVYYYFSPAYTDAGYRPKQPVPFSHKLHAGDLGLDCRYCHSSVELSVNANVPPTQTCMNCHQLIKPESQKLALVRESFQTNKPIEWIRVHNLPDYAYFDHRAHVSVGVGCESCHGNISQMEEVMQMEPLSMGWCLDCHRNPAPNLRPLDEVTTMGWQPSSDHLELAAKWVMQRNIAPPEDCSGCHR